MFQSLDIKSLFDDIKPSIVEALEELNSFNFGRAIIKFGELLKLVTDKKNTESPDNEMVLNEYYVLQAYLKFLGAFSHTWQHIYDQEFSVSWDLLQASIGHLRDVKKFAYIPSVKYVEFFEDQVLSLEELYPYGVFFSIGAVVDHFECSICGHDIDSLECSHRKGELYAGEVAIAIARNITKLDHVSVVENPVDKSCVPQYEDVGPEFNVLRYFSELLINHKMNPLDFGELEKSTRVIENPEYIKVGRNQPCYCGSGLKFKKCCIDKRNIEGGHIQIISNPQTAVGIMA